MGQAERDEIEQLKKKLEVANEIMAGQQAMIGDVVDVVAKLRANLEKLTEYIIEKLNRP